MVIILMGASGAGKTTVGRALARDLGWRFVDGDDHHSPANIDKIARGEALTDADRRAWLRRLRVEIDRVQDRRESLILACSALKETYRHTLADGHRNIRFVYLKATAALLRERVANRAGHFAGPDIIESQMRDLEEPGKGFVVDAADTPGHLIAAIRRELGV